MLRLKTIEAGSHFSWNNKANYGAFTKNDSSIGLMRTQEELLTNIDCNYRVVQLCEVLG